VSRPLTKRICPKPVYAVDMHGIISESVVELLGLAFYTVVASALTVAGALAERAGLHEFALGHATLGLWETGVGLLLLYAGVSVAREFVLPRLRDTAQ
jgi:hypothetical protein